MRTLLPPAIFLAVALAAGAPTSAQVTLDTSSPDAVMTSLAELHGSWTHEQFLDFMRAAMMAGLPDDVEDPASWQESRNRWEFLPDTLAIHEGISGFLPLVLEGDPLVDRFPPEKFEPWVQKTLRHALEDRTIGTLVGFGRRRERAVLLELRKQAVGSLPDLEQQLERAEAHASRPGASTQHQNAFERQARRLADHQVRIGRLDRRLEELESEGVFAPGAIGCSSHRGLDLSTEETMLADVEALARTCPQQMLIRFLRAAAFVSEVPAGLPEPGARMDSAALRSTKDRLRSGMQVIVGFAAVLQKDPLIRGVDSIPGRLRKMLEGATEGRTMPEIMVEGMRLEGAFLAAFREELSNQLQAELEERRREALEESASPKVKQLRVDIERIDRRLALLEASAPAPLPPRAN